MTSVSPSPTVAALDLGSNSIKILVARRAPRGGVEPLLSRTLDARISAGISHGQPRLTEDSMARGLAAVQALLADAAPFRPAVTTVVATSAVRDAGNGAEFRARVLAATGHPIQILTGEEEANLIGRGLTSDPALAGTENFYVFDLGGGSLECLAFRGRRIEQAVSLQLGCVRLTEKFVADSAVPLPAATRDAIARHTRDLCTQSGLRFSLPPGALAIGTGGTVSTVRAMLAAQRGLKAEETEGVVPVTELQALSERIGALPLTERRQVPGLPPARADVFPAAAVTILTIAELGGFTAFRHSWHNLRYGLVDRMLAELGA